jgi:5'-3' exonuclease
MRALLDGDIYAFRSAASAENDNLGIAIYRVEEMIDNTLNQTGADEFSIFLSGDNNFRYEIYPEYKATRSPVKPKFLKEVKDYLIEKYKAEVSDGCEADDLLGIAQCEGNAKYKPGDALLYQEGKLVQHVGQTIICSLDKDLRMIPGMHYSFEINGTSSLGKKWTRPMEIVNVEPFEGIKRFYTQLLTGDSTDNVRGVTGIGKVKAEAILRSLETEKELYEAVADCYSSEEELLMNGQCLWIFRKPNDRWRIPDFATN